MYKIMIISDTHKNQILLRKAFSREDEISHIFHLGDYYDDLDTNFDLLENREFVKVPGLYHPGYQDGTIPATEEISLLNWNFRLVHNIYDIKTPSQKYNITFFGHTHHAVFKKKKEQFYLNPGHLKATTDRGRFASYLLLELDFDKLTFYFKYLDGRTYAKHIIKR